MGIIHVEYFEGEELVVSTFSLKRDGRVSKTTLPADGSESWGRYNPALSEKKLEIEGLKVVEGELVNTSNY